MPSMIAMHIIVAALTVSCHADDFLGVKQVLDERISEENLQQALSEEIENSLGVAASSRRNLLEAILLPMYRALPKNENGKLGHSTVRYALHRLFVFRHGWSIRGLSSGGESWNYSSPVGVLKGQAPDYIQELFEQRLGGKGLNLRELAVLAATVEHLVHNEIVGQLENVFSVLQLSRTQILNTQQADIVLDTYMMGLILGRNVSNMSLRKVHLLTSKMPQIFTGWKGAQKFVRGIRATIAGNSSATQQRQDFAFLAKVTEIVSEEYGTFQNIECQELKQTLMGREHRGTGRVKLADFYRPALGGEWQFQENIGYLRQLGAMDESDPSIPSVIIPNYLHSQTNCLAASGFFSVCCKDECEGLMGRLEEKFLAPEATPKEIAAVVALLPSSTITIPRQISSTLMARLKDISSHHGGMVPLHGRLFAQWMHHAFPRECPYPHISGTTFQQTAAEWLADTGTKSDATQEEMRQWTTSNDTMGQEIESDSVEELLHWSTEEELLVTRVPSRFSSSPRYAALRSLMLLAMVGSFAFGVVKSYKLIGIGAIDMDNAKFVV